MMKIDFKPDVTFRGTVVFKQADGLAYAYETTDASADADGAPNSYHPDDQGKDASDNSNRGKTPGVQASLQRDETTAARLGIIGLPSIPSLSPR